MNRIFQNALPGDKIKLKFDDAIWTVKSIVIENGKRNIYMQDSLGEKEIFGFTELDAERFESIARCVPQCDTENEDCYIVATCRCPECETQY